MIMGKEKIWFCCPICKQKLLKTDERAKGGVYLICKKCSNEVEVIHQNNN